MREQAGRSRHSARQTRRLNPLYSPVGEPGGHAEAQQLKQLVDQGQVVHAAQWLGGVQAGGSVGGKKSNEAPHSVAGGCPAAHTNTGTSQPGLTC